VYISMVQTYLVENKAVVRMIGFPINVHVRFRCFKSWPIWV